MSFAFSEIPDEDHNHRKIDVNNDGNVSYVFPDAGNGARVRPPLQSPKAFGLRGKVAREHCMQHKTFIQIQLRSLFGFC